MRARIETTDALTLLRELPDGSAQMCIARPPRHGPSGRALEILAETRRVCREDGTLWLLAPPAEQQLLASVQAQGWKWQRTPAWARALTTHRRRDLTIGLFLFSKRTECFHDTQTTGARRPASSVRCCAVERTRSRNVQRCAFALEQERDLRLVRRCVIAGSSPVACGVCGAPYRRTQPGESTLAIRCPTCSHNDPGGRCLVLDPFYEPGLPTAQAAVCARRSFLGITDTTSTGQAR
jgi:hypothetical protein